MQPTKKSRIPSFVSQTLETKWSNLLKPDTAFGDDSANHNITVVVDAEFKKVLAQVLKASGAKKINGLRTVEGVDTFKAKSKVHIESGKFPCHDSQGAETTVVPFGGDKVRLRLAPMVIARDNSLSIYLNGVQIIEKNSSSSQDSKGFDAVDGGFVSQSEAKPEIEDNDLPF